MKKKIIISVVVAVIAIGVYITSRYVPNGSTAEKLSSLAAGMLTAIFLVSLASAFEYYKKNKKKTAE
jgi:uncharacterized BrkB/YihY/UPF0761 family membrane protein